MGMCAAGRWTIGYIFLTEFLTEKNVLIVAPIINASAALALVFGTVTFQFITKYTIFFETATLVLNLILVTFIFFFIPESPKYLIASRKFNEAREALSYVAKFNGVRA